MRRYIECSNIEKELEERYNFYRKESETKVGNMFAIDKEMQTAAIIAKHCLDQIKEAPTADVVAVRHGEWIKQKPAPEVMKQIHDMGLGKGMSVNSIYWTCSICENWGTPNHKYCCSCGAKMDGERREE